MRVGRLLEIRAVSAMFLGYLGCDHLDQNSQVHDLHEDNPHLGFGRNQSLTNLPWPLVTFLFRDLDWGLDGHIGALLDRDVDTLLALNLVRIMYII